MTSDFSTASYVILLTLTTCEITQFFKYCWNLYSSLHGNNQPIAMYDSHVFDLFQDTIEEDNSSIVDKILGSRMRKADKDVSNLHTVIVRNKVWWCSCTVLWLMICWHWISFVLFWFSDQCRWGNRRAINIKWRSWGILC